MGWCDKVLGFCDASGGEVDPPPYAEEVEAPLAGRPQVAERIEKARGEVTW